MSFFRPKHPYVVIAIKGAHKDEHVRFFETEPQALEHGESVQKNGGLWYCVIRRMPPSADMAVSGYYLMNNWYNVIAEWSLKSNVVPLTNGKKGE